MRKIFTFLFAALMSVGMYATTVTWNSYDLPSSGSSFTKDGVTVTCDIDDSDLYGPGTFTTDLGNFTQIVVSAYDACYIDATGGWSGNTDQMTWTGNAASVSWDGSIYGFSGDVTIVFTIEEPGSGDSGNPGSGDSGPGSGDSGNPGSSDSGPGSGDSGNPEPQPATIQATQFNVPANWEVNADPITASDLPGFTAATTEQAMALANDLLAANPNLFATLIYGLGNNVLYIIINGPYSAPEADSNPYYTKGSAWEEQYEYYNTVFYTSGGDEPEPTAVENVQTNHVQATKFFRDGQLLIEKNGKLYNATGAEVK